jgi:3-keto-disaccharide hydrolase
MRLSLCALAATLLCVPALKSADNTAPEGFDLLFNGKDLSGWKVNEGGKMDKWGVDKGVLYVQGAGGGWLMTEKEYGDFELQVEFKIPEKGNSGVALRSPMKGDPAYVGMEIQILDDAWHKKNLKDLKPVQLTGSIYGVVPPSKDANKPIGEWNKYVITAKGRKVTIELNGVKIVDANLDDHKDQFEAHSGLKAEKGHLGLQSHSERVEFRNIYVKELK